MKYFKSILHDLIKCAKLATIISGVAVILSGIIGLIVNKGNFILAVQAIKATLLIVGSFGLILGSILLLKKNSEKEFEHINEWKEKYIKFSYKVVIVISSFIIIFYGSIIDWTIIIFNL